MEFVVNLTRTSSVAGFFAGKIRGPVGKSFNEPGNYRQYALDECGPEWSPALCR